MGAGWCRAGGVRGAAPVGLRTERAVFFLVKRELIGIEPQRTWAMGWGAVPKSDCEPGRVIERPGRVAEPEGCPKPLDVGA